MADRPMAEVVGALGDRFGATLAPGLTPGTPVALVGFPNYANVGDSAIWAGEVRWLRRRGHRVAYVADELAYAPDALRRRLGPDGAILLQGGGNFGTLYPHHQELRERVVADHPERRIVQLPQTLAFDSDAALQRTRDALAVATDLTLLCREPRSLELAARLGVRARLSPDAAFALGPIGRTAPVAHDIVWLARTDDEARAGRILPPGDGVRVADWPELRPQLAPPLGDEAFREVVRVTTLASTRLGAGAAALQPALARLYDRMARRTVAAGLALVSSGRVVVTDRLHGHVLCLLAGVPHVVVDSGYGKLRGCVETWTGEAAGMALAGSAGEALERAQELLAGEAQSPPI